MSAQANIRNMLFDQKSPWYPEVSWILLINVKNMWVKKYPFVWEVCHHRPKLEIFSLTRSLHNHKSGFFQCCALNNSFLFWHFHLYLLVTFLYNIGLFNADLNKKSSIPDQSSKLLACDILWFLWFLTLECQIIAISNVPNLHSH